jgi:hypothetical protein
MYIARKIDLVSREERRRPLYPALSVGALEQDELFVDLSVEIHGDIGNKKAAGFPFY